MIANLHQADVNVKVVLPTGPGDFILISVTPGHAHVNEPKTASSEIIWHLSGAPPSISGLEFPDGNGIVIVQPTWDPAWGTLTRVDAKTYKLELPQNGEGAFPTEQPFKYNLTVQWVGGSAQIDPEIEFDPE